MRPANLRILDMTQRITKNTLYSRIKTLNALFGYSQRAYAQDSLGNYSRSENGGLVANANTFILDCAYGGYRLCQMCKGGGERDITPRGTARETYDCINAFIYGAEAMLHRSMGKS